MAVKTYTDIPDMIKEVEITSILDNDFGSINNNPLTIAGITNRQIMNG